MQRIITVFILCLSLAVCTTVSAQDKGRKRPDRKEWFNQMRSYKHDFMARELSLTKEQQEKFFPLYDEMEGQIHTIQRESMMVERKINLSSASITDLEYEEAAKTLSEVKGKEAAVEERYFSKFKDVLSAKQLFELKLAERKFTRELMKQHSRMQRRNPGR